MIGSDASQYLVILRRKVKWHGAPATSKQIALLRKLLRGKNQQIPAGLTKGEAARVIGQQLAKAKPHPPIPAWVRAKIQGAA
jgi:hypothetical protein